MERGRWLWWGLAAAAVTASCTAVTEGILSDQPDGVGGAAGPGPTTGTAGGTNVGGSSTTSGGGDGGTGGQQQSDCVADPGGDAIFTRVALGTAGGCPNAAVWGAAAFLVDTDDPVTCGACGECEVTGNCSVEYGTGSDTCEADQFQANINLSTCLDTTQNVNGSDYDIITEASEHYAMPPFGSSSCTTDAASAEVNDFTVCRLPAATRLGECPGGVQLPEGDGWTVCVQVAETAPCPAAYSSVNIVVDMASDPPNTCPCTCEADCDDAAVVGYDNDNCTGSAQLVLPNASPCSNSPDSGGLEALGLDVPCVATVQQPTVDFAGDAVRLCCQLNPKPAN